MREDFIPDVILEREALTLLKAYEDQEGRLAEPPVPIDLLIENLLQIDIDWAPIDLPSDERVLAAIELTPRRRRIIMNEREREHFERYNGSEAFSKAHEVGHAVLHLPHQPGLQPLLWRTDDVIALCRSGREDRKEIQAERFAAYLLMPEHLVRAAVQAQPITNWHQIYQLRDAFAVSITAMCKRLVALNLVYITPQREVFPSREAATGQQQMPI
jgi:hypothetical protein